MTARYEADQPVRIDHPDRGAGIFMPGDEIPSWADSELCEQLAAAGTLTKFEEL